MKQVEVNEYGDPDVLTVREVPTPEPQAGQVRIRVGACGINFADLLMRAGLYPQSPTPPFVPGVEVAGTIDSVGPDVDRRRLGDRVFASIEAGGYAEYVLTRADKIFSTPDALSDSAACTMVANYLTAWVAIRRLASIQAGETVVIDSAGGSVGLAAFQLVKHAGARALGIATPAKHTRLLQLGYSACFDATSDDRHAAIRRFTAGRGVDVFLDCTGGAASARAYDCLAPLGRLICNGTSSVLNTPTADALHQVARWRGARRFAPYELMMQNKSVAGIHLASLWADEALCVGGVLEMLDLAVAGALSPVVDRKFPLEQANCAHRYLHERRNFGKVVLAPR